VRLAFGANAFNAQTDVDDGRWHHCVVICRGTRPGSSVPDVDIYLDGAKEPLVFTGRQFPWTPVPETTPEFDTRPQCMASFGGGLPGSDATPFPGDIDEITVFDGVLPASQIPALMDGSLVGKATAPELQRENNQ